MDYTPGAENYNSNDAPCMLNCTAQNIIIDHVIDDKLNQITISDVIKQFYREFSSSNQELYMSGWTFFSLDNIIKMCENYKKDNILTVDLAFIYMGMGHVKVAFYHPLHDKIVYRFDGGSSDHDRNYNYKEFKKFDTNKFLEEGISFQQFLDNIKKNNNEIDQY